MSKVPANFLRKITCDQCQMLSINGHPCHETGCPNAWRHEMRRCKCCGCGFIPLERYQQLCDVECAVGYYG